MELGGALGPALVVGNDELPSDSLRPQADSETHLAALNGVPARRRHDRCYRSNAPSHAARLRRRADGRRQQAAGSRRSANAGRSLVTFEAGVAQDEHSHAVPVSSPAQEVTSIGNNISPAKGKRPVGPVELKTARIAPAPDRDELRGLDRTEPSRGAEDASRGAPHSASMVGLRWSARARRAGEPAGSGKRPGRPRHSSEHAPRVNGGLSRQSAVSAQR